MSASSTVKAKWASKEEIEVMIDEGIFIPYQKDLLGYLFFAREGRGTWDMQRRQQ